MLMMVLNVSLSIWLGDFVTLTAEFSAQAQSFCIIRALGPPEGPSACVQISADVPSDAAIGACTRSIKSGEIRGDSLAEVHFFRGFHYASRGDLDRAIGDFTAASRSLGIFLLTIIAA